MTKTVALQHAKAHLEELAREIGDEDEVLVEDGGRVVARILAPAEKAPEKLPPRTVDDFRGRIWIADDFDEPLPDDFWGFDKPIEPS